MTTPATSRVTIHTDGACLGNPGPGGWGAVLRYGGHELELHGGDPATTNNRMELMAAIQALETLTRPSAVDLHTDSSYVRNGIMSWVAKWKANGWRTAAKAPVKAAAVRKAVSTGKRRGRRPAAAVASGAHCAIIGCKNPGRTKGYCSAHYQKLRMLIRTHRRPDAWADFAAPNSVADLVLPRGRAAKKAKQA